MTTKLIDLHKEAEELHMAWTGSRWQHYQGDLEIVVVYRSDDSRKRWVRKLTNWQGRVNPTRENPDGVPRFRSL